MEGNVITFEDGSAEALTKSARSEARRQDNMAWKFNKRSEWSDEDPNPRHTAYYAIQLPDVASEWNELTSCMSRDLLVSFRLCNRTPFVHHALQESMDKVVSSQFIRHAIN
jgi:hypothetical protein